MICVNVLNRFLTKKEKLNIQHIWSSVGKVPKIFSHAAIPKVCFSSESHELSCCIDSTPLAVFMHFCMFSLTHYILYKIPDLKEESHILEKCCIVHS